MAFGKITLQLKNAPEKKKEDPTPAPPVQMPAPVADEFSFSDNGNSFMPFEEDLPELSIEDTQAKEPEIPSYPDYEVQGTRYLDGMDVVRVAIIAPTMIQAKDFICSSYCNMLRFVEGRSLSLYTRDHPTILLLSEAKQNLEIMSTKPLDVPVKNNLSSFNDGMHTITIGKSGDHTVSLDINFLCGTYSDISAAASAESVIIILNFADESMTSDKTEALVSMFGNRNVNWVISGFEGKKIFYSDDFTTAPSASLRRNLKEKFNVLRKTGDTLSYAQIYGGLTVTGQDSAAPVYRTVRDCRDYLPVGCAYPLVYALQDIATHRSNKGPALSYMENIMKDIIRTKRTADGWKEVFREG